MRPLREGLDEGKEEILLRRLREQEDRVFIAALSIFTGPGPEERSLWNRFIFKVTGNWPQSVVDERLYRSYARTSIERWRGIERQRGCDSA